MTVTTPWQGTFNGLTFGVGSDVQVTNYNMFRGLPSIRRGDLVRPRRHGSAAGLAFLDERIFNVDFLVAAPKNASFETVLKSITTACQNVTDPANQKPFELLLPEWPTSLFVTCRPTKGGIPINLDYQYGRATVPVEFTAADPLVYSTTLKTITTGLPTPTAGLTFPVTFPATFGASSGGSMQVTNAGAETTYPVITIAGPCTNPYVQFSATGARFGVNLTLAAGDTLVIDMNAQSVILNGTAARFNAIVTGSSWWGIPPGTWSIGVGSSDSAAVAAQFQTQYRDAWGFA